MTVDTDGADDYYRVSTVSLDVDSSGVAHMSYEGHWTSYGTYSGQPVRYARVDGSSVDINVLDAVGGYYSSLDLDSSGIPHMAFYDGSPSWGLDYVKWTGPGSTIETARSGGQYGGWNDIVVDSGGKPHISYYGWTGASIYYSYKDASGWHHSTVDSGGSVYGPADEYPDTSIDLGTDGKPRIAYNYVDTPYRAKLMEPNVYPLTWTARTLPTDSKFASMVIDPTNGYAHLAYAIGSQLRHAVWTGSAWSVDELVSNVGTPKWTSIDLDSQGRAHIAYYNAAAGDLVYSFFDGTTWQSGTVDSAGDVGVQPSLALDINDLPHIAYYDWTNHDLKYAYAPEPVALALLLAGAVPMVGARLRRTRRGR